MKQLLKLYFKIFKCYQRLELRCVSWSEGDNMIKESVGKPEEEQWVIAKEEDYNRNYGTVYLERKKRIR